MLACGSDVTVLENFTYGDTPDAESVSRIVENIVHHEGEFDLSLYDFPALMTCVRSSPEPCSPTLNWRM